MKNLLTWHATIFELVLQRPEFYGYIVWNLLCTTICIFAIEPDMIDSFNWDAASIMQYVMTFFVTFYNDKCFERYQTLYPACQDFMDNVVNLVQEMNVSLPWRDLHYHRIAVTKYLLAIVQEYFMIVCGGKLQAKSWDEFVLKGLLTKEECKMLEQFPGGESTFVLTSWVMFILRDALVQDCMWRSKPGYKDWMPQQTVHIFNRHQSYIIEMQKACHKIGYTMANPIPFAYYHLMNVILIFNIGLTATFTALFRSYMSVFPFAIGLLVYMGMREISCALADPFGRDSIDFPIPDFIRQNFDNAVSQLLAFIRADVREMLLNQIENVEDFQDHHLRRSCKQSLFGNMEGWPMKGTATAIRWTHYSVFEHARPEVEIGRKMKYAFSPKEYEKHHVIQVSLTVGETHKELKAQVIQDTKAEKESHKVLKQEIVTLKAEYDATMDDIDKLIDKYPHLHDESGATVTFDAEIGDQIIRRLSTNSDLDHEQAKRKATEDAIV